MPTEASSKTLISKTAKRQDPIQLIKTNPKGITVIKTSESEWRKDNTRHDDRAIIGFIIVIIIKYYRITQLFDPR